ncbi:alpha/beta fold hydrolase [Paenibacillus sp. P46E]|uniref:alpha/beta fold hydrolase n=1 Tax=Paenibacillus sp. P46E TaxID=1349436 RepID=UPI00093BCA5B|nr:alpha/beta hydrolase [Paenibacillus sp. P46E]OKQ00204.1 hypothetical protein A3849_00420 [Paenibacillus sp. P46E]
MHNGSNNLLKVVQKLSSPHSKPNRKRDFIKLLTDGGFHYKVIPDAGHGINHEQPEAVNREIVSFLLGVEVQ